MNNISRALLGAVLLEFIAAASARALPAYKKLWEKKYNYNMSCAICHTKGGGSELTGYGKDFQRFGISPAALKAIEERDSDGDGFTNIKEIRAKSNPGNLNSTPANPTGWLDGIEASALPLKQLQDLFPGFKKFSVLEGTLLDKQVLQIEKDLDKKLPDEDKAPTFYFALREAQGKLQRTGVALFITPGGEESGLIVAVGMDLGGKVTKVSLAKNEVSKKLADKYFLAQFAGKAAGDPVATGKDIRPVPELEKPSELVAQAVKEALLISRAVFAKQ
ncbi:MAG: hypothetical protein HY952_03455 [Elusimicrobia bacterium]|nr:hypothetical protein [Elusimicrobiota bacterium]